MVWGSALGEAGGLGVSVAALCPHHHSPAAVPLEKLLQAVPIIPSPQAPHRLCGTRRATRRAPGPQLHMGGHRGDTGAPAPCRCPGTLTSEPLAQDALQQLADGGEVWGGVRAGPPGLPKPQHLTCRRGGAAPLGAQADGGGCWGSEQPWVGTVGGAQGASRVRPTLAAG